MNLAEKLKSKIDEKLRGLPPDAVEKFDLEEQNFKDIFLYVGQEPTVIIEIVDINKNIFLGKDA